MRPAARALLFLLLAITTLLGCSKATSPPAEFTATGNASGQISLSGESTLKCVSTTGPVSVEGEGLGTVRWFLAKYAVAPTQDRAHQALDQIIPTYTRAGDTLVFDVAMPPARDVYSSATTTLGIPFGMNCVIENSPTRVVASDLRGTLRVRGTDSVTVERHVGSCDIVVSRGALVIEVAVPDSGACVAQTGEGIIDLRLPASSSATLTARTASGTISVTGLALADRVDGTGYVFGRLGTGAATFQLETKKGNITVTGLP